MQTVTRPLLLLHSNTVLRERVRRASHRQFDLQHVTSWTHLQEAIRESAPGALVLIDPYADGGSEGHFSPALRALLRDFPSATVVAAMSVQPDDFRSIRTLGTWGVAEIVDLAVDTTSASLAALLDKVSGQRFRVLLETSVLPHTSGRARSIVLAAADVVATGGQAEDLAESLGISRRTLLRWCDQAGLPPPRRLLTWLRILLAAELLDERGRTVSSIARVCGYASGTALRTALQMQLHKTPKTLRREGAFATASQAFVEELRRARVNTGASRRRSEADGTTAR
jgi:AraC-like DNA-binding protein